MHLPSMESAEVSAGPRHHVWPLTVCPCSVWDVPALSTPRAAHRVMA
jgi:hypothetical protein